MINKNDKILSKVLACLTSMEVTTENHNNYIALLKDETLLFGIISNGLLFFRSKNTYDKHFIYKGASIPFSEYDNLEQTILNDKANHLGYSDEILRLATKAWWIASGKV